MAVADDDADGERLVICLGTHMVSAGFAGDDAPRAVFPTVVGRPPRYHGVMVGGMGNVDAYVGDDTAYKRGVLRVNYPLSGSPRDGAVENWDDLEKVLHHTIYNELRCDPEEHSVLVVEHPMFPATDRRKLVQVLFETFNVPQLLLYPKPMLQLFACGRERGVSVHLGHESAYAVPMDVVPEGDPRVQEMGEVGSYRMAAPPYHVGAAGTAISAALNAALLLDGYCFVTSAEREIVRDIKERLVCFEERVGGPLGVASGGSSGGAGAAAGGSGAGGGGGGGGDDDDDDDLPEADSADAFTVKSQDYELPDGQVITLTPRARTVPVEMLMNPVMTARRLLRRMRTASDERNPLKLVDDDQRELEAVAAGDGLGLVDAIVAALNDLGGDKQPDGSDWPISLCGGSSMFPGMAERVEAELQARLGTTGKKWRLVVPPERKYADWIGGSILGSLTSAQPLFFNRADYHKHVDDPVEQDKIHQRAFPTGGCVEFARTGKRTKAARAS